MFRHVPNLLTALRLVLAVVFFAFLAYYQYEGRGDPWFLNTAFVVYLVALVTDFLDGYLARLWKVEGALGRVLDPFVDKVLVLGSFIFFAGKNFIIAETAHPGDKTMVVRTITGVAPGIVVVLLGRELLVTMLRGVAESGGQAFGAVWAGKVKMVIQSVTILVVLSFVNYYPDFRGTAAEPWLTRFRDACIWITVIATVWSGVTYLRRVKALYEAGAVGVT